MLKQIALLTRDIGLVSLGRYSQYIVTLVALPLLARNLGVVEFGRYGVMIAASFFGSALVDLGLTQWMATRPSRRDAAEPNRLSFTTLRLTIFNFLALASLVVLSLGNWFWNLIAVGILVGGASSLGDEWILIKRGRFATLAGSQLIARVAYILTVLFVLPLAPSAYFAALLLGGNNVLAGVLTVVFTRSASDWTRPSFRMWRALLSPARSLLPARFVSVGYSQGPILAFSSLVSPAVFGLFASADKLTRAGQSMLDAFGVAMIPRLLRDHDWASEGSYAKRVWIGGAGAAALGAALSIALVISAHPIVGLLFGSDFRGSIALVQIQSLAFPAAAFTSYSLGTVLVAASRGRSILLIATAGVMALVPALGLVAINPSEPWRMSIGILVIEYSVAVLCAWTIWRVYPLKKPSPVTPAPLND